MLRALAMLFLGLMTAGMCLGQSAAPLLMQHPTLSRTQIVFAFAGHLWVVARQGGDARRLTREYEGNIDVYVISAAGGAPVREAFSTTRANRENTGVTKSGRMEGGSGDLRGRRLFVQVNGPS
jgi:hypothetical protein